MKKLVLTFAATAALAGQAFAADMAVKARPMAPAPIPVTNWTGCYISGGGGYGLWQQENTTYAAGAPRVALTGQWDAGGRGYFGTVGGGCDYQFGGIGNWNIVVGAFADYDFADIKGDPTEPFFNVRGREKLSDQWSVGGRIGALITPNLLSYFSAGYTEARFDAVNPTFFNVPGFPNTGLYVPAQTYSGYFLGGGYEYALNFLPGLYWKTEYRFSDLDTQTNIVRVAGTGAPFGVEIDSHKYVHTVRSQLVWRFNWGGGSVVAKY